MMDVTGNNMRSLAQNQARSARSQSHSPSSRNPEVPKRNKYKTGTKITVVLLLVALLSREVESGKRRRYGAKCSCGYEANFRTSKRKCSKCRRTKCTTKCFDGKNKECNKCIDEKALKEGQAAWTTLTSENLLQPLCVKLDKASNDLPNGWTAKSDKEGRIIFEGKESKRWVWEKPKTEDSLPSGWTVKEDPKWAAEPRYSHGVIPCNRWYYYNQSQEKSQWEYPTTTVKVAQVRAGGTAWTEQTDPATGRTYYWNKVTNVTTWNKSDTVRRRRRLSANTHPVFRRLVEELDMA